MNRITRNSKLRALIPMSIALFLLWPGSEVRAEDQDHDGWFAGVGYGYCRGVIETDDAMEFPFQNGVTPQVRFGHSLSDNLSLGLEYGGWVFEEGDIDNKFRYSLQSIDATVTWYPDPTEGYWGGFYARAGAGLAWIRAAWLLIEMEEQQEQEQIAFLILDETGLGLLVQVGYEFQINSNTGIGISAGFNHLDIRADWFEQAQYVPLTINLNWYWD